MMRIFFLIATALTMTLQVIAQDAFVAGTIWTTYVQGVYNPRPERRIETASLEVVENEEDYLRMNIVTDSETKSESLSYFIRTEGGKVYFSLPTETLEWKLLYDFTMGGDELGTEIYSPWETDGKPYLITKDICAASKINDQGLTEMTMHEYGRFSESEGYAPWYNTNTWLKGIGSVLGVMRSNHSIIEGAGYSLVDVRNGDTVFYSNPAAVKDLELAQLQMTMKDGKLTYTELADPVDVVIINTDGRVLLQSVIHGTGSLSLPGGLSIIRVGGRVFKALGR